jgi:hypothetical protein
MEKIKFSRKYIVRLAVAVFLTVLATSIVTACYGVFVGVVSGVGLVFVMSPFLLKTIERLGEWLEMEKPDRGMRMRISDEMINRINLLDDWSEEDRLFQILEYDWLESVDKVRQELKKVEDRV